VEGKNHPPSNQEEKMEYPGLRTYKYKIRQQFDQVVRAKVFADGSISSRDGIFAGNRAIVFPVSTQTAKLALKCWHKDPGNIGVRYKAAKSYIETTNLPYFTSFDYIDDGVEIDGRKYPISYMDWIDGQPLGKFIEECIMNYRLTKIARIAEKFREMMQKLHEHKIAHGDLQEGNIFVCPDESLKLIDYDCLYVPPLKNVPNLNKLQGIPSYQYPGKRQNDETADYFSELVIYLSLHVYAKNSTMWAKGQEMRLLFTADDFLNPYISTTFRNLIDGDFPAQIRFLAKELQKACKSPPDKLLPLEKVIKKVNANVEVVFEKVIPITNGSPRQQIIEPYQELISNATLQKMMDMFSPPISSPIVPVTNTDQQSQQKITIAQHQSSSSKVPSKALDYRPVTKIGTAVFLIILTIIIIIFGGVGLWLWLK
jgi:serine/threonine protein kinase